jgi:hypothetical protein
MVAACDVENEKPSVVKFAQGAVEVDVGVIDVDVEVVAVDVSAGDPVTVTLAEPLTWHDFSTPGAGSLPKLATEHAPALTMLF